MTPADPAADRSRPASLPGDVRAMLYQAIADLAETALWLPGRFACEHDRAADLLARLSGDLARAATALRAGRTARRTGLPTATVRRPRWPRPASASRTWPGGSAGSS
jgi:hypothetical protein